MREHALSRTLPPLMEKPTHCPVAQVPHLEITKVHAESLQDLKVCLCRL